MPVAVFDVGAPAERLRNHPLGLILTSREPARIVAQLEAFWQSLHTTVSRDAGRARPMAAAS